jgi:hypothetical protein
MDDINTIQDVVNSLLNKLIIHYKSQSFFGNDIPITSKSIHTLINIASNTTTNEFEKMKINSLLYYYQTLFDSSKITYYHRNISPSPTNSRSTRSGVNAHQLSILYNIIEFETNFLQ